MDDSIRNNVRDTPEMEDKKMAKKEELTHETLTNIIIRKDRKISDLESNLSGVIALLVLATLILITTLTYAWDNIDVDDRLAPLMCSKYNSTVQSVEHHCMTLGDSCYKEKKLIITCKKEEIEPIENGYLIKIN